LDIPKYQTPGDPRLYSFSDMLDSIVSAGVPYALGMRWPISIPNSNQFACEFYKRLFEKDHNTIEGALQKTRQTFLNYKDHSTWSSPVLFKQEF
jgi:CHAT domain